jgi:hypothetical protein
MKKQKGNFEKIDQIPRSSSRIDQVELSSTRFRTLQRENRGIRLKLKIRLNSACPPSESGMDA